MCFRVYLFFYVENPLYIGSFLFIIDFKFLNFQPDQFFFILPPPTNLLFEFYCRIFSVHFSCKVTHVNHCLKFYGWQKWKHHISLFLIMIGSKKSRNDTDSFNNIFVTCNSPVVNFDKKTLYQLKTVICGHF